MKYTFYVRCLLQSGLDPDYMLRLTCHILLSETVSARLHVGFFHLVANWVKVAKVAAEMLLSDQSACELVFYMKL